MPNSTCRNLEGNLKRECLENPNYSLWVPRNDQDLPKEEGNTAEVAEEIHGWFDGSYGNKRSRKAEKLRLLKIEKGQIKERGEGKYGAIVSDEESREERST